MPYQFLQLLPDFKKNKKLPQMLGEYFKLFKVFQSFAHTRKPRLIHTFWIRNKEHQTTTHNQMIRRKLYVSGWDKNSVCLWKIKCFDISPENKQTDQAFLIFICLWATIIRSFFNSLICESVFSALGRDIQKRTFASCSGSDRLRHCHMIWPISCPCNFLRYKKNTRESLSTSVLQTVSYFPRYADSRGTRCKTTFLNISSKSRENGLTNWWVSNEFIWSTITADSFSYK